MKLKYNSNDRRNHYIPDALIYELFVIDFFLCPDF